MNINHFSKKGLKLKDILECGIQSMWYSGYFFDKLHKNGYKYENIQRRTDNVLNLNPFTYQ